LRLGCDCRHKIDFHLYQLSAISHRAARQFTEMFREAHNLLLFFLNCVFASASGRIDGICLSAGIKASSDNLSVDCDDAVSSFDRIIASLPGGGNSFGGAVLSAMDGETYTNATKQYASARVVTAPSFIVQATNQSDVRAAIIFAAHCEYKVTARSGGHSYMGLSSCDGSETPCIQIDVGKINHIYVNESLTGSKQVSVGPGVRLVDLYPALIDNDVYIPAGECGGVGVGGHMQTGGFGIFGRSLGRFNSHITAFDIILADGSLVSISSPQKKKTTKFNDDIWYAVIGGASGSFGVIVDVTFNPIDEQKYSAFSWEVNYFYSDTTKHCIQNMFQEFATMLADENFANDSRWNIMFTLSGTKTYLFPILTSLTFNSLQLDFTWVATGSSGGADTFSEAQAIYDRLHNAYTFQGNDSGCITLDQYFEMSGFGEGKTRYPSTYANASDTKPMSVLHKEVTLVDWSALGLEKRGIPFTSSYQQGPKYPHADELLKVFDVIDALMPKNPQTDQRFVTAQMGALIGPPKSVSNVAQPFQDDLFGVSVDVWSLDGADYSEILCDLQDLVISSVGGVDHRTFWGAYEDICLECGAWNKYYESRSKYDRLRQIKGCVDPDDLFKFRMSIPVMKEKSSKSEKRGKSDTFKQLFT
ncbi:hypothetical protein ACHAWX_002929, partial [Stephanocyclus meneghinianus]